MDAIFNWIRGHIHGEWSTVTSAPMLFSVAVVITALVLFFGLRAYFRERMETMREHIAHKDSQLGEYKDKLKGATPTEVVAEITELKSQIVALNMKVNRPQRRLTKAQKDRLSNLVNNGEIIKNFPVNVFTTPDTESSRYGTEIQRTLSDGGLFCEMNSLGKHDEGESGVIFYSQEKGLSPQMVALSKIFTEIGILSTSRIEPNPMQPEYIFISPEED